MKKTFLLFAFCFVLSAFVTLAYTSNDVSNATLLANQDIIVRHDNIEDYRLDDTITRAEAIGVAIKLGGISLPSDYVCKNYFTDVQGQGADNWICRAVELAADNNLITRENETFRPYDTITRAEALAIMVSAGEADETLPEGWTDESGVIYDNTNEWQASLIAKSIYLGIITAETFKVEGETHMEFSANTPATRAQVFEFASNIVRRQQPLSMQQLGITVSENAGGATELVDNGNGVYTLTFLEERTGGAGGVGGAGGGQSGAAEPYPKITIKRLTDEPLNEVIKLGFNKPGGITEVSNIQYFHSITYDMCDGNSYTVFSELFSYTFAYICGGDYFAEDAHLLSVDGLLKRFDDTDVLAMYYGFLDYPREEWGNAKIYSAFGMRSPMAATLENFAASFQQVTDVTFRADTVENLGNNTYEFLVDMTESDVVSTYKVTSKVNLNTFTLEEISAEKV